MSLAIGTGRWSTKIGRHATKLMATLLAAASLLFAGAASASAVGYGTVSSHTGYAYVRAVPGGAWLATAWNGYTLTMYCWVDSVWAYGNYWTNRWFQVAVPGWRYGGVGYIHASLVANQPALPHC